MDSIFCLAPSGWGWGGRMKAAVLHGCIPVVIQPDIKASAAPTFCIPLHTLSSDT